MQLIRSYRSQWRDSLLSINHSHVDSSSEERSCGIIAQFLRATIEYFYGVSRNLISLNTYVVFLGTGSV